MPFSDIHQYHQKWLERIGERSGGTGTAMTRTEIVRGTETERGTGRGGIVIERGPAHEAGIATAEGDLALGTFEIFKLFSQL